MRTILGLVLFAALMSGGLLRAQTGAPLFKLGADYVVSTTQDAPSPFHKVGSYGTLQVKIIKYGADQWYWVEFDTIGATTADKPNVTVIMKDRMWLNFALVMNAVRVDEPDYASIYPKGFQIVPWKAQNW